MCTRARAYCGGIAAAATGCVRQCRDVVPGYAILARVESSILTQRVAMLAVSNAGALDRRLAVVEEEEEEEEEEENRTRARRDS